MLAHFPVLSKGGDVEINYKTEGKRKMEHENVLP